MLEEGISVSNTKNWIYQDATRGSGLKLGHDIHDAFTLCILP